MNVEPILFVRWLSAGAALAGGLFVAFALVYGRLSAISHCRLSSMPPRSLTPQELHALALWQRRTVRRFALTMGAVVLYGLSFLLERWLPSWVYLVECVAVLVLGVVTLAFHFSARCPECGRRLGFQSTLLLPLACEVCGAVFRPAALFAGWTPSRLPIQVVSRIRIFGWPLFAVAVGGDPATGRTLGVARAVVAVGDLAIGGVAVGGVAVGVLPVGGVSIGILSVGGVAIGLGAVGGLAAGALALGGVALGIHALGGIAAGPHSLGAW
ncbi:MAG TPA: hypothetical protein VEG67_00265, partial [Myxococcota bacterium]|nr:hypothetical protein [Myxococcota bacterium]